MGELSEQNRALIEREIGSYTNLDWNKWFHLGPQTLNDLLDAARTEGRGEGEPVAYMMKTAGSGSRPVLPSYVYAWREKGVSVDAQPLYASPIREPEISRTALIETMRQHIKADAVGLAPAVIAHCLVGFEEAADAILNLAPVGGRGEEGSARADLSPASRSPAPAPHWIDGRRFSEHAGERWRHVKRGSVYSLPFGRAEAMVQCAEPITDESVLTIYIGEDGMIFARPTHEFHDGRFEPLPPPPQEKGEG